MAGLLLRACSGALSVTTGVAHTYMTITTGASNPIKIKGISVSFNGVASTDPPILVELRRYTGAIVGAITPTKNDLSDSRTVASSVNALGTTDAAKGGYTQPLYAMYVHPQSGWQWSFSTDQELVIPASGYFGIELTPGTIGTTKVVCNIEFEE